MKKSLPLAPQLSAEESELFRSYAEERRGHYRPQLQKRHAETMLELFRPGVFEVYHLRKEGKSIKEISAELGIGVAAVRIRSAQSITWLTLALFGGLDKKLPM